MIIENGLYRHRRGYYADLVLWSGDDDEEIMDDCHPVLIIDESEIGVSVNGLYMGKVVRFYLFKSFTQLEKVIL